MLKKKENIAFVTYDYYHNKIIDIKNNPTSEELRNWRDIIKLNYQEGDVFIVPILGVNFEQQDNYNTIKKMVRDVCNGLLTNILDSYLNNRLNGEKGDTSSEK